MEHQSIVLLALLSLLAFKTLEAAPLFDTQIGEFIREFIFSGGTMDQDDEPFSLDFEPSDNAGAKKKKVLVLSKDEEFKDVPRVRTAESSQDQEEAEDSNEEESTRTKRQADPQVNKAQMQKILNDLTVQLKDPKIQSRTIGEFLEGMDESFMNTVGISAMSGMRAFFQQFMSNFFN